jgi:GNAT superfamily N-acetyltransferase
MSITYQQELTLTAAEYISVLSRTTMRDKRPLGNTARIQGMLDGANFIVTARESDAIVGLARCITDFSWIAYCAELAVVETHQGLGVGQKLIEAAKALLGPQIGLSLIAEPEAEGFYRRIGMQQYAAFFLDREDRS